MATKEKARSKKPLEALKKNVSAKSTAGLLRDQKKRRDEQIKKAGG